MDYLPPLTVVALHGLVSSPDILRNAVSRAERASVMQLNYTNSNRNCGGGSNSIRWVFPAAPVAMEKKGTTNKVATTGVTSFEHVQYRGWYTLPPSMTSSALSASELRTAFDTALDSVVGAEDTGGQQNLFVLFGHSQGGLLISALLDAVFHSDGNRAANSSFSASLLGSVYSEQERVRLQQIFKHRCIGVIIAGGHRWNENLPQYQTGNNNNNNNKNTSGLLAPFPSLHIIGARDAIVHPAQSLRLAQQQFENPTLFRHDAGHAVPQTKSVVSAIVSFLGSCLKAAELRLISPERREFLAAEKQQKQTLLKAMLLEEIESAMMLLPEGSSADLAASATTTTIRIKLVLPNLEDTRVLKALYSVSLAAAALKSSERKRHEHQQQKAAQQRQGIENDDSGESDDDDDDEHELLSEAARTASSFSLSDDGDPPSTHRASAAGAAAAAAASRHQQQQQRQESISSSSAPFVLLCIEIPVDYGDDIADPASAAAGWSTVPKVTLSHLPPLLALQSFRRAQLLVSMHETIVQSAGQPVVLQAALAAVTQLQDWVSDAVSRVEKKAAAASTAGTTTTSEEEAAAQEAAADPWRDIEEEQSGSLEERTLVLSEINAELDKLPAFSAESLARVRAVSAATAGGGGQWKYSIGMAAKPSVGKSSLCNALCDPAPECAQRCAAHPFTTIESTKLPAFTQLPCACSLLIIPSGGEGANDGNTGPYVCGARYGHVPPKMSNASSSSSSLQKCRRHPISVFDVAGLVPGAYQGRGRGCAFLSDLCGVDALIQVVAPTENSTDDGEILADDDAASAISPEDEIRLIRNEVISWIAGNLIHKWPVIRRRPAKLRQQFSGYQAQASLVDAALSLAGLPVSDLDLRVPVMTPRDVLRLACIFYRLRFPTVIVANKCDRRREEYKAAVELLRSKFPQHTVVATSARVENRLLELRRQGKIRYVSGDTDFVCEDDEASSSSVAPSELEELRHFLKMNNGSGAVDVLAAAIALNPPSLVYPFEADLDDFLKQSATAATTNSKSSSSLSAAAPTIEILRDCFALKRGTTADGAFRAIARDGYYGSSAAAAAASSSNSSSSGASSAATGSSNNRSHMWSLVRCDIVTLPPPQKWVAEGGENESTTMPLDRLRETRNKLVRSLARKDDPLPAQCLARMVFSKTSG